MKKIPYYFMYLIVVILSVLSARRIFGNGPDYSAYKGIFSSPDRSIEPFFSILRNINLLLFQGNIFTIYFIVCIIALILKFKFISNYSHNFFLSFVFYIFTFFFLHEYTQIRAAIAIGIFLLSLDDILHHRIGCYILKTGIAFLFHYSSVLMLVLYLYCNLFKKKHFLYLIFPWSIFLFDIIFMSVLKNNIIASLLADFSQKDNFIGMIALYVRNHAGYTFGGLSVFNKLYLSLLIICSFMYYAYSGFTEIKYEKDSLLFKTLSFALVSFYSLLNFALPVLTYRVSEYFLPVISVVLPNLSTRIKEKQIFFIVLSIYIFLLSYLLLTRTTSL